VLQRIGNTITSYWLHNLEKKTLARRNSYNGYQERGVKRFELSHSSILCRQFILSMHAIVDSGHNSPYDAIMPLSASVPFRMFEITDDVLDLAMCILAIEMRYFEFCDVVVLRKISFLSLRLSIFS